MILHSEAESIESDAMFSDTPRRIQLEPEPDSLPDEHVESWLENFLNLTKRNSNITLSELGIENASHPAIFELTYLFNKEAKEPLSVAEMWEKIRSIQKSVSDVRGTISKLLQPEL